MAENGINGHKCTDSGLVLKAGLLNNKNKYLTAENFGQVNITGKCLKKKQIWSFEQVSGGKEGEIHITSHQGKYVSADKFGNVSIIDEDNEETKFVVEYPETGCGRWLLRNVAHGNLLGSKECDGVQCFTKHEKGAHKESCEDEWTIQMCMHPQVNMRNVQRSQYAHLCDDELQCGELIPWGEDSLVTLEFKGGRYAIRTSNHKYLRNDGTLEDSCTESSLFMMEIKATKDTTSAGLAFKDNENRYLTASGKAGTMKVKNKTFGKEDLFAIQDSHPQVVIISNKNKRASIKQGIDVSANQEEETDKETFQIEFQGNEQWAIRSFSGSCWTLVPNGGIQDKSKEVKDQCLFGFEWQGDGTVLIKTPNGQYLSHKQTGALVASDSLTDEAKFKMKIINRPLLVLRCPHGFVGTKPKSSEYICNKADYDTLFLEGQDDGTYSLRGHNGKFWSIGDDNTVIPDGDVPTPFVIEFRRQSFISIKAPNGCYLKGEQNGLFRAIGTEINQDTLWEF